MSIQERLASFAGDLRRPKGVYTLFPPWFFTPILWGEEHSLINGLDYTHFEKTLERGDFLLCYSRQYFLSNKGIVGSFKHACVYTGEVSGNYDERTHTFSKVKPARDGFKSVTHSTSDGVIVQTLYDCMRHYDCILAVRATDDPETQALIVKAALETVGLPYNFDFTPKGPPSLFCTELVQHCLTKVGLGELPKRELNVSWRGYLPWNLFGKKYYYPVILADDIAVSFKAVASTASCDLFWRGSIVEDKLRTVINNCPDFRG